MLAELDITPLGRGTHLSKDLAEILKIIDESGVRYTLTPFGTCLEGEWDELDEARSFSGHVLTTIRLEDEAGVNDKLVENIASVEHAAGRRLSREVLAEVAQLLWAAQGHTPRGHRTAPSAGALYPLEVFVIAVPADAFPDAKPKSALKLRANEEPLCLIPVGRP
jgi:uncharacterized protein YqgV (UPF0045/DUF77 family)